MSLFERALPLQERVWLLGSNRNKPLVGERSDGDALDLGPSYPPYKSRGKIVYGN